MLNKLLLGAETILSHRQNKQILQPTCKLPGMPFLQIFKSVSEGIYRREKGSARKSDQFATGLAPRAVYPFSQKTLISRASQQRILFFPVLRVSL